MPLVSEQPIFTISSPLGDIQKLGNTPYGERRVIDIHGGTVDGPKLKGKVLPGGADWQIVRADGVVAPDRALHAGNRRRRQDPGRTPRATATARPR